MIKRIIKRSGKNLTDSLIFVVSGHCRIENILRHITVKA
ncbi:hypothetical protein SDC9_93074 [bioreactor metagenome]|uniref:Uncharacterized protein n=1 Tax=bioreactor metagenome TaxID=1076179 RepID=A0A644ZZH9_9ZZZZ